MIYNPGDKILLVHPKESTKWVVKEDHVQYVIAECIDPKWDGSKTGFLSKKTIRLLTPLEELL